jgi:hypothetical protein
LHTCVEHVGCVHESGGCYDEVPITTALQSHVPDMCEWGMTNPCFDVEMVDDVSCTVDSVAMSENPMCLAYIVQPYQSCLIWICQMPLVVMIMLFMSPFVLACVMYMYICVAVLLRVYARLRNM